MNSNRQAMAHKTAADIETAKHNPPHPDAQDERYPGSFFRVPGIPAPGKTTWSLAK